MDDAEDDWDLERDFPFEERERESANERDVWVDLEEGRREEDEDEDDDEDEVETVESRQFSSSPTRRAGYSSAQFYSARRRSPVQAVGGARHPPPVRPRRGQRRRSGQYYGPHQYSQTSPLYYRGRGQGAGRYRLAGAEEGWGMRQFR